MKDEISKKISEAIELICNLKAGKETALVKIKLDEAKLWLTQVKE